jgi:hypothetical protein
VALHERFHFALNESNAWGTVPTIFAAPDRAQHESLRPLLEACEPQHEAYATFGSFNLAGTPNVRAVSRPWPCYSRSYDSLATGVSGVGGPGRQQLAANALAIVSMQTPILSQLLDDPQFRVRLRAGRQYTRRNRPRHRPPRASAKHPNEPRTLRRSS